MVAADASYQVAVVFLLVNRPSYNTFTRFCLLLPFFMLLYTSVQNFYFYYAADYLLRIQQIHMPSTTLPAAITADGVTNWLTDTTDTTDKLTEGQTGPGLELSVQ